MRSRAARARMNINLKYAHRLLAPRMIYIITSMNNKEKVNAGTFTYLTPVSSDPQMLVFSTLEQNDTYKNILEQNEFVVNIPNADLIHEIWICGDKYSKYNIPSNTSEIELLNLTLGKSSVVKTPYICECYGHLECYTTWIKKVGDHFLILGEIVSVSVDNDVLDETNVLQIHSQQPLLQVSGPIFSMINKTILVNIEKNKEIYENARAQMRKSARAKEKPSQ